MVFKFSSTLLKIRNVLANSKSPLFHCRLKMATKLLLRSCPFSVLKVGSAVPAGQGGRKFSAVRDSRFTIKTSGRTSDNFASAIGEKLRLELAKKPIGALKNSFKLTKIDLLYWIRVSSSVDPREQTLWDREAITAGLLTLSWPLWCCQVFWWIF